MAGLSSFPRISFGLIVLNGEPFTKYCLRSLYPFAYEIIVVEGAVPGASGIATHDGHSTDGTPDSLHQFKAEEDPEDKLRLVSREGFWNEKGEMSKAYAEHATGDYLWQVDIDEFYKPVDLQYVIQMLRDDPTITAMSFKDIPFWGGFSYYLDSWYQMIWNNQFHRVFRWGPGNVYSNHRPPTVLDPEGTDVRRLNWITADEMQRRGIFLYHYSLVFPRQVQEKCRYYGKADWALRPKAEKWAREVYFGLRRPFWMDNVYHYPGWIERFSGEHPPEIEALRADLTQRNLNVETRPTEDIERLLSSRWYGPGKALVRKLVPLAWPIRLWFICNKLMRGLLTDPIKTLRFVKEKAARMLLQ